MPQNTRGYPGLPAVINLDKPSKICAMSPSLKELQTYHTPQGLHKYIYNYYNNRVVLS